jgi:S-adenosylmethionine synthetase
LFTSESVTEGHPDKMCDAISDSILDALLEQDRLSRVAVETMVTTGQVHVAGEVTTSGYVEIPGLVRERILEIGYDSSAKACMRRASNRAHPRGISRPPPASASKNSTMTRESSPAARLGFEAAEHR